MNNISTQDYDLVIVGAGLVGATLACAIAQTESGQALRIAVIEAGSALPQFSGKDFDPRVVALTHASQQLLYSIGAWKSILAARACPYRDMHVWDGEGTAEIHFSSRDVRQDCLGYIVENSVALAAVREQLVACANVEIIQPASVISVSTPEKNQQTVNVTLDSGRILKCNLLIAADGAHSQVRQFAGFTTREWDYHQKAIITTVRTELPHSATAWQRFMHTGPLAFLPLPDANAEHYCSIVWSADTALADELMALSDVEFCHRLGFAFEHRLGYIKECAQRYSIPLQQRHAREYIRPAIALVGDAAHNIHPLAGQGVNLGLLDAAALGVEIERAINRSIPLADYSILRRYQRQRLAGNLGMMAAMEGFKRLFGSRSLSVTSMRNIGMRRLNELPMLKNYLIKLAMGL